MRRGPSDSRVWTLAAILAVLVAAAIGAFALAAPAGGGRQLQTSRLEVVSANIAAQGGDTATARICFDADVGAVLAGTEIYLQGYDAGDKLSAREASTIEGSPRCVLAEFYEGSFNERDTPSPNVGLYTIAVVPEDTVVGVTSEGVPIPVSNVQGAARLDGSAVQPASGSTASPNLRSTSTDLLANTITYVFDRDVDHASVDASAFGFFTSSGNFGGGLSPARGESANVDGNAVTVQFDPDDPEDSEDSFEDVSEAERYFVWGSVPGRGPGARSRTQADPNATHSLGAGTDSPDVTRITRGPGLTQYTVEYDEAVLLTDHTLYSAYTEDGTRYAASEAAPGATATQIIVTFEATEGFEDKVVRVADEGCAVNTDASECSTVGSAAVRTGGLRPGFTDGPDLRQIVTRTTSGTAGTDGGPEPPTGEAVFTFDHLLDASRTPAGGLVLLDAQGDRLTPSGAPFIVGSEVHVPYDPSDVALAVGGTVDDCVVFDPEGKGAEDADCNPINSLALGLAPAGGGGGFDGFGTTSTGGGDTTGGDGNDPLRPGTTGGGGGGGSDLPGQSSLFPPDAYTWRGAAAASVRAAASPVLVRLRGRLEAVPAECSGTVSLGLTYRGKALATGVAPLRDDCTYATTMRFDSNLLPPSQRSRGARPLFTIFSRFNGNQFVPASSATPRRTRLKPLPPPVLGRTVNLEPLRGRVTVRLPRRTGPVKGRRFVGVSRPRQVPVRTLVNVRRGRARLTTATDFAGVRTQSGAFSAGVFQSLQRRRTRAVTELRLKGGSFAGCNRGKARGIRAVASRSRTIRRLRSNARGRFRTRGRNSSATVRGTAWITADRCDGTLTRVTRGRVLVRDFRRRRNVLVRAGSSFLARARR